MPATVSVIFIIVALIMLRYPPRKINQLYGYRTPGAMKSEERWNFAQEFSARKMLLYSTILLVLSPLGTIVSWEEGPQSLVATAAILGVVAALFIETETALRRKFPIK